MLNQTRLKVFGLLLSVLLASGCQTARHIPSDQGILTTKHQSVPAYITVQKSTANRNVGPTLGPSIEETLQNNMTFEVAGWDTKKKGDPSLHAYLSVNQNMTESKTGWGSLLLYFVTLTLVPATSLDVYDVDVVLATPDGQKIYERTVTEKVKTYLSVYFPMPLISGRRGGSPYVEAVNSGMQRHEGELLTLVDAQHDNFVAGIQGKELEGKRQWLRANATNLFGLQLLPEFAKNPPTRNPLQWHKENVEYFSGYAQHMSKQDQLWFVGPEGHRVIDVIDAIKKGDDIAILAANIEQNGPYKQFDSEEVAQLKKMGLTSEIIAAMVRSGGSRAPVVLLQAARGAVAQVALAQATVAEMLPNNTGAYMNPWTSDDVLADWTDKAINAKIGGAAGSAVGAAAGAYAANKVFENIPFVGAWLGAKAGSKLGKKAGRNAGIAASGGMEYIRSTSDQSFRTLGDMARYLKANYSSNSHYAEAVKAADVIYSGLLTTINSLR